MQRLREAGTAHILRRLRNFTRFTCQVQTEKETLRLKRVYAVVAPVVFGNWRDGQQPPASSFLHGTHRDNPPITMATAAHAAAERETGLLVLMGTVPGGVVLNRLPSSVTLPEQALT